MHPWFSWIRWVNPVQYGFEGLMSNEFYDLQIQCVPPNLVPQVQGATTQYQGCTVQGSTPGSAVVNGADYIRVAFTYSRSHLWRNFGFICAFFGFFVLLTAVGMELQKPNKGGGAVTIYKRGQAPKSIEKAISTSQKPTDLEKASSGDGSSSVRDAEEERKGFDSSGLEDDLAGVAKNESIFTFQNVNYTIPYQKGQRQLLRNVQGYVRPGKVSECRFERFGRRHANAFAFS
jgi:ATP-binding cassette, subfamily G (WHITE), member 2, SNQ2